jgi:hypothetical protein
MWSFIVQEARLSLFTWQKCSLLQHMTSHSEQHFPVFCLLHIYIALLAKSNHAAKSRVSIERRYTRIWTQRGIMVAIL